MYADGKIRNAKIDVCRRRDAIFLLSDNLSNNLDHLSSSGYFHLLPVRVARIAYKCFNANWHQDCKGKA